MYAEQYRFLRDVATLAFKTDAIELINGSEAVGHQPQLARRQRQFSEKDGVVNYACRVDHKWLMNAAGA